MARRPAYKAAIDEALADAERQELTAVQKLEEAQSELDAAQRQVAMCRRILERAEEAAGNGDEAPTPAEAAE